MYESNAKKIIAIILVVVLLLSGAGAAVYFLVIRPKKNNPSTRMQINSEKPPYERVLEKSREDFPSEKEFALYLYERACYAFQQCEESAIIEDYVTTTTMKLFGERVDMDCQGCRFTLKKGTEYYYADYSGAEEDVEDLLNLFGAAEDSLFAKRSYTDIASMDYMYTEKILHPTVEISEEGEIDINADWSTSNIMQGYPKHEETPIFHSLQEGKYQQTEMVIEAGTVSGATVNYYEEMGYYTVSFVLDVNNPRTSEKVIGNLRKGLKDGQYTSITKVYQIWDNGYFRKCESLDYAANKMIELKLDFKSYFKYGAEDCDPQLYQYFPEAKEKALADKNK